jgi:hypothetical protein
MESMEQGRLELCVVSGRVDLQDKVVSAQKVRSFVQYLSNTNVLTPDIQLNANLNIYRHCPHGCVASSVPSIYDRTLKCKLED